MWFNLRSSGSCSPLSAWEDNGAIDVSPPCICHSMSLVKAPLGSLLSSLYGPCSATLPSADRTIIVSARLMVDSRWAMEMVVLLPRRRLARAELTRVSDSASKADVARIC